MLRNSPCWCGSGKKYKACHEKFDEKLAELRKQGCLVPPHDLIKNDYDIMMIRKSAKINNGVLDYVEQHIKAGVTTNEIDQWVSEYTISHGGKCGPLNYEGYPKSVCVSINEEVCHGIPSDRVLKDGDIVNVDVTTDLHGYFSDASRMFMIGNVSEEAKKLVQVTKECLDLGVKAAKPWGHVGDIGAAIAPYAEAHGYSVVTMFCGHGVGKDMHEDPFVMHKDEANTGMILVPGMLFTIEPMINQGTEKVKIDKQNGWTSTTLDGKLSAQWEYTLLVKEKEIEIIAY